MSVYLKSCGEIRADIPLVYYPIGYLQYVCYNGQNKEIVLAEKKEETNEKGKVTKRWYEMQFQGETYIFKDAPINDLNSVPYTNYITEDIAKKWIEGKYSIPFEDLWKKIEDAIGECYEFNHKKDLDLVTLFVLETWFVDVLNAVFYLDIRSSMGGGKTTLIEIIKILSRYGIIANDVSMAVIPRLIDRYKCTLVIDEIDQINIKSREDIYKILRTGYRRGQKYIRAKPKTFEPEVFDCYGAKAFNYRSDVVDDLKSRSIPIDTSISTDKSKPIINLHKETFLKEVIPYIWAYYMNSLPRVTFIRKLYERIVAKNENIDINFIPSLKDTPLEQQLTELTKLMGYRLIKIPTTKYRDNIGGNNNDMFGGIMLFLVNSVNLCDKPNNSVNAINPNFENLDNFSKYVSSLIERLKGRNIELFYIILELCAFLGTDVFDWFSEPLSEKQEFEQYDETDYKSTLKEILCKMHSGDYGKLPSYHELGQFHFFSYRDVQMCFNEEIHRLYGIKPGSNELKKQLREIGFVDKFDKKVIKYEGKSVLALIFTEKVLKQLGLKIEEEKI